MDEQGTIRKAKDGGPRRERHFRPWHAKAYDRSINYPKIIRNALERAKRRIADVCIGHRAPPSRSQTPAPNGETGINAYTTKLPLPPIRDSRGGEANAVAMRPSPPSLMRAERVGSGGRQADAAPPAHHKKTTGDGHG